jgi:hypothetical protein
MKTAFLFTVSVIALNNPSLYAGEAEKKAPPGTTAAEPAKEVSVRLRFLPGGGPWKGETPTRGASWTILRPGLTKGFMDMRARAGVGDTFPVEQVANTALFHVKLAAGNDDQLFLEVIFPNGEQRKVTVDRDKSGELEISGVTYRLSYPSSEVAAAPNEKPTTNKATIVVSRRI